MPASVFWLWLVLIPGVLFLLAFYLKLASRPCLRFLFAFVISQSVFHVQRLPLFSEHMGMGEDQKRYILSIGRFLFCLFILEMCGPVSRGEEIGQKA